MKRVYRRCSFSRAYRWLGLIYILINALHIDHVGYEVPIQCSDSRLVQSPNIYIYGNIPDLDRRLFICLGFSFWHCSLLLVLYIHVFTQSLSVSHACCSLIDCYVYRLPHKIAHLSRYVTVQLKHYIISTR